MRSLIITIVFATAGLAAHAQNESALLSAVRAKLALVKDYSARGTMIVDVPFINASPSEVTVYFKNPDQFKVVKEGGVSILPKGGVSVNLNSLLLSRNYTVIPAGTGRIGNQTMKVVKLIPLDERSEVVLTTLYIDEKASLIRKAAVTTKENGSYEIEMDYGKYASYGLPDRMAFVFNLKDYKLPKGFTFEYEKGEKKKTVPATNKPGRVELRYKSYTINKGVPDAVFKQG